MDTILRLMFSLEHALARIVGADAAPWCVMGLLAAFVWWVLGWHPKLKRWRTLGVLLVPVCFFIGKGGV
jgi:hypothetical protein